MTGENGLFAFPTIVPARHEPRPRHIHFKVKVDGADVLTSQFYFAGDIVPFFITLTEPGQYMYYCSQDKIAYGKITVLP